MRAGGRVQIGDRREQPRVLLCSALQRGQSAARFGAEATIKLRLAKLEQHGYVGGLQPHRRVQGGQHCIEALLALFRQCQQQPAFGQPRFIGKQRARGTCRRGKASCFNETLRFTEQNAGHGWVPVRIDTWR